MQQDWQVWNEIIEKGQGDGAAGLTEAERTIFLVNRFLCDVENGSFSGFLYNVSPTAQEDATWSTLRSTTEAVDRIGQTEVARLLRQAATALEAAPVLGSITWGTFLATVEPAGLIMQLDEQISRLAPDVWQSLSDFTFIHFQIQE